MEELENKWKDASKAERGFNFTITEKYFTPSIEDIRVGYECFWIKDHNKDLTSDNLLAIKFTPKQLAATLFPPYEWERENNTFLEPNLMSYRVPYLTKEQIEAEGWKEIIANLGGQYEKGNFKMLHGTIKSEERVQKYLSIVQGELCRYAGECKDINTFRYICKLLGI